jgi:hypothetical protein
MTKGEQRIPQVVSGVQRGAMLRPTLFQEDQNDLPVMAYRLAIFTMIIKRY